MTKIDGNHENLDNAMEAATQEQVNANAWSEEEFYDNEIVPLMKELYEKCSSRNIPCLIHIICADDGKKMTAGTCVNTCKRDNTHKMHVLGNLLAGRIDETALLLPLLLKSSIAKHKED